jgi:predicted MFS family arabinose efflux permease
LSYVATLELVSSFSEGSGLALSSVILIRFLPSLLLSPVAGVLADSCNRINIIVSAAIADAVLVVLLVTIREPNQIGMLFALLSAQFAAIALQDPAKKAIVPVLVPEAQLHLATTLETFSWSLTGAVGAAVGGYIASKLGNSACFLIDGATYVIAAFYASKIPRSLGNPHAKESGPEAEAAQVELHGLQSIAETDSLLKRAQIPIPVPTTKGSYLSTIYKSWIAGAGAAAEGFRYLAAPDNRDVMALVMMKGCGSVTWGAVDVLNVKFSELPRIQVADDAEITLGLIFAMVGVGCFLGPVLLNLIVSPREKPLVWACAAAFCLLFVGSALMAYAQTLFMVLVATLVRAVGSSTLWIYSTLLLQFRCPNSILGRVSATEMAIYTIAEASSSVYGGAAFDVFHFSLQTTVTVLAVLAGGVALFWVGYAIWLSRTEKE